MKVSVQSVNFNIDRSLLDFVEKKIGNLEKFHDQIIDAEVYLKVQSTSEKENKITEVKINIPGNDLVVKKQNKSFEEGVSNSFDALKKQLVKRKEKMRV